MKLSPKICASFLAGMLAVSSAFAVSAADSQPVTSGGAANVDVTATVKASVISASVPTRMTITIDPNQTSGSTVVSSRGTLTSTCTTPVDVQYIGAKAADGTAAKVFSPDTFGAWAGLGIADTQSHMAVGFVASAQNTYWSRSESENNTASLGAVKLMPGESKNFHLDALHGNAWPQAATLQYILTLRIALSA